MFCWPMASALGLLDAESKNFIFVRQGHCDLHVKCCRRMQPDVTGFSKVRMVDLDGFKQCKLGLRYVKFTPVQTFRAVLRGRDNESWKTRRNQKKKAKLATQVGHTAGRRFTKQLPSYNKRKLCRKKKCGENITQRCSVFSEEEPLCKGWSSRISWDSNAITGGFSIHPSVATISLGEDLSMDMARRSNEWIHKHLHI